MYANFTDRFFRKTQEISLQDNYTWHLSNFFSDVEYISNYQNVRTVKVLNLIKHMKTRCQLNVFHTPMKIGELVKMIGHGKYSLYCRRFLRILSILLVLNIEAEMQTKVLCNIYHWTFAFFLKTTGLQKIDHYFIPFYC